MKALVLGKMVFGVIVVSAIAGAIFYFSRTEPLEPGTVVSISSELNFSNVGFAPEAVTVAPGVHLLGKVVPGSAYAIETDEGVEEWRAGSSGLAFGG